MALRDKTYIIALIKKKDYNCPLNILTAGYTGSDLKHNDQIHHLSFKRHLTSPLQHSSAQLRQLLLPTLLNLEDVEQSPRYHPEGNALYHSLQVFELAYRATSDPELWAAALFHDIGKAINSATHDDIGAEMLTGLLSERIVWLVAHHLDLLKHPARTRKRFRGTAKLQDLQKLRKWDLAGRRTDVDVMTPEDAVNIVLNALL